MNTLVCIEKNQNIAGYLNLSLEFAAVAVLYPHPFVDFAIQFVVEFGVHFMQNLLDERQCGERIVENFLSEVGLLGNGPNDIGSKPRIAIHILFRIGFTEV
ncbi:MAG: hypothetical protein L6V35_03935 [Alistipes putredinis]|nr:MAG: hypothetical protein L6V35_03935 [Alistipes putredinis]